LKLRSRGERPSARAAWTWPVSPPWVTCTGRRVRYGEKGMVKVRPVSRRPPRLVRSDAVRTLLLRAAGQVLVEDGHAAASMSRIALRAGVSRPELLAYFPTKEALMAELVKGFLERTSHALTRVTMTAAEASPRARVRAALDQLVAATLPEAPLNRALLLELPNPVALDSSGLFLEMSTAVATSLMERHQAHLRVTDVSAAGHMLATLVRGSFLMELLRHPHSGLESGVWAREMSDLICRYLLR